MRQSFFKPTALRFAQSGSKNEERYLQQVRGEVASLRYWSNWRTDPVQEFISNTSRRGVIWRMDILILVLLTALLIRLAGGLVTDIADLVSLRFFSVLVGVVRGGDVAGACEAVGRATSICSSRTHVSTHALTSLRPTLARPPHSGAVGSRSVFLPLYGAPLPLT